MRDCVGINQRNNVGSVLLWSGSAACRRIHGNNWVYVLNSSTLYLCP